MPLFAGPRLGPYEIVAPLVWRPSPLANDGARATAKISRSPTEVTVIGHTIGPYHVLAKLGEGGMGEVYRARDTKLDREVAIKVLPDAFVSDPQRVARFQREARTLAALNHPHIGGIYGLEDTGGL